MVESQTPQPDKIEVWWGRLLNQPMAVCLIVSILGNVGQLRMSGSTAEEHRKEVREVRQEAKDERAKVNVANHERDVAQQKAIDAKDESIKAKDITIAELQKHQR